MGCGCNKKSKSGKSIFQKQQQSKTTNKSGDSVPVKSYVNELKNLSK